MEAIISAAETGFTGSLVGSKELTRPALGTIRTIIKLTMFLVSMPRQQSSTLLPWEPPHWYRRPRASWTTSASSPLQSTETSCEEDTVFLASVRSGGQTSSWPLALDGSPKGVWPKPSLPLPL
uniref:Uncharacterized protein n=1 Tax=Poecilia mexicana TaxID=48701 RepID=A0A3B3XPG3_9TELE